MFTTKLQTFWGFIPHYDVEIFLNYYRNVADKIDNINFCTFQGKFIAHYDLQFEECIVKKWIETLNYGYQMGTIGIKC